MALLVGGHDSSAASLAWAFERLARHPDVQARLRDGDPAYLDAVVKEVLRARPALTIAPRLLLEPADIAGHRDPRRGPGGGLPVAGVPARGPVAGRIAVPSGTVARRTAHAATRCRGSRSAAECAGCAGAPFAEMEMREVLRAAAGLRLRPASPGPERARRSMLVLVPHRGAEVLVG